MQPRRARTPCEAAQLLHEPQRHGPCSLTSMRALSIVALVAGLLLLFFGFSAGDSLASEVSETVTGNPTDRSMWLLISGAVLTVFGGVSLLRGRKD